MLAGVKPFFSKNEKSNQNHSVSVKKNSGGWMGGWIDGWEMGVKAILSFAYNNPKFLLPLQLAISLSSFNRCVTTLDRTKFR